MAADAILFADVDIVSPNALGAILSETSIPRIKAGVIAGGANNQLAVPGDGARVHERGILYAPDYVINAGGIINVCLEYLGHGDATEVEARVAKIPLRLAQVWDESAASGDPASDVADRIAQRLIGR
jgi:leucine dehydrogenase